MTIFKYPVALGALLFSSLVLADGSDTIIKTLSNPSRPAGKSIEIKNVDLHRFDFFPQEGGPTISSYSLSVYLWVSNDLGEQTNAVSVIDTKDLSLKPIDQPTANKVGFDQSTQDFVYEVRMPVDIRDASQTSAFYASVVEQGATYYSNEGSPDSYFIFTSNQK